MKSMLLIVWLITIWIAAAQAQPIEIHLDGLDRAYRYTGTITLREPVSDRLLSTWRFVSGGYARGSAPFGRYEIGEFLNDKGRPRWQIREPGRADGEVWDVRVHDMRTDIQLHRVHSDAGTMGCIGVVASEARWAVFVAQLRGILAWYDVVAFDVLPDQPIAVAIHEKAR